MLKNILIPLIIQLLETYPTKRTGTVSFNNLQHLSSDDWLELFQLASIHRVDMLLYYFITESDEGDSVIPEPHRQFLKNRYRNALLKSLSHTNELKKIIAILKNEGIESLVLKGASLAESFYLLPELRPCNDIDILVHQEDMGNARELLITLGYSTPEKCEEEFKSKYWYSQDFTKMETDSLVEIHWNIAQLNRYKIKIDRIWDEAVPFKIGNTKSLMMSVDNLIIYLSLHSSYHYHSRLLWLLDIAFILKNKKDSIDWESVLKKCKDQRVSNSVYYSLLYIRDLLKIDMPFDVLEKLKPGCLTDNAIRWILDTRSLPDRKIVENKILRFPFAFLLVDHLPEKLAFSMEFLNRIAPMNRLNLKQGGHIDFADSNNS